MSYKEVAIGTIVVLACTCSRFNGTSQSECDFGFPRVVQTAPSARSVLEVPPHEMREVVHQELPVMPDRRFVLAAAELEEMMTGRSVDEVHVVWDDSVWVLRNDDLHLGVLVEVPSFADALSILESRVRQVMGEAGLARVLPQGEIDALEERVALLRPQEIIQALGLIDAQWRDGRRDSRALALAARGLVLLDLQGLHEVEVTDGLAGKAMAALALARAVGRADLTEEEALLAYRFGYSAHAVLLADRLPATSHVRAYVRNETEPLRLAAERPGAPRLARYLYLTRLAEQRNTEVWRSWIERFVDEPQLTTSILSTGFQAGRHEITRPLTPILPYLSLMEFWSTIEGGPDLDAVREFDGQHERELGEAVEAMSRELGRMPVGLVRRFEQDSRDIEPDFPGPFAGADVVRAYYGGYLYGSIHHLAQYYLDTLASVEWAGELLRGMEGAPPPVGGQLVRWYGHLVQSGKGRGDIDDLTDDLSQVTCLGVGSWMRTFDELQEQLPYADPRAQAAANVLERRLDSRPYHQFESARLAKARFDLSGRDRLYRRVVHLAGPTYVGTKSWLARASGDTTTLRTVVEDDNLTIRSRKDALEYLIEDSLAEPEYLRDVAILLIESDPNRWDVREVYLKYLESIGEYEEGIEVIRDWRLNNPDRDGFEDVDAQTALARMYYRLGDYRRAESAIENVIGYRHAGTVGRAALIFQEVRREEEAVELARWGVQRYPDFAFSRVVLAEVLWRQRRFNEVPEVLNDPRFPLDLWAWRNELAEAFLRVFGGARSSEAEEAFAEIVDAGIPSWTSEGLPQGLSARERPDLAYVLQSQLGVTDAIGSYRNPVRAYVYLKAWKGEAAALEWIRPRIPSDVLSRASRVIYDEGADELLWELIPDPEKLSYPDVVWLTRAASVTRSEVKAHLRELRGHYQSSQKSDFDSMGRYLVGLKSEDQLLELAQTAERKAQIAYYVGLKAESEGRISDAIEWYRVVLGTGEVKKYEYSFAFHALEKWVNTGYTLARLEDRALATP